MLIIPVLDISQGVVVHAVRGERSLYKPIQSSISKDSKPESVLSSFFELYPFQTIYIADLDSIQGKDSQSELINKLAFDYKDCQFWLDAGIKQIYNKLDYKCSNIKFILGTENNFSLDEYDQLLQNNPELILSLDFDKNGLMLNSEILNYSSYWPKKVFVMMLNLIGSNKGIDKFTLEKSIKLNRTSELYSAGGIKDISNVHELTKMNMKGCLISTALHQKKITSIELNKYDD